MSGREGDRGHGATIGLPIYHITGPKALCGRPVARAVNAAGTAARYY